MTKILSSILATVVLFFGCSQNNTNKNEQAHSFEKIIFHTTRCFGACPVYHLQIDANQSLKLFAEKIFKGGNNFSFEQDTTATGYYRGLVNDTTFALLNKELKTIGLDTLEFDGATCCDASLITIIVYYEGKRKFLKSMFPPDKANRLIATLYDICEKSVLTKTTQKFDIEGEEASDIIIPKHYK